ncbi:hypothetical protein B0J14DRAFT_86397 [Halenospora varia]|nr:hypothetical protein B0J14DRAFT_86397 [Halenospora varia]
MAALENPTQNAESAKFGSLLGIDMVDLYVGPSKHRFHVHRDILCTKIPYFAKMFGGGFVEATTNSAEFPEDEVQAFDLMLFWVYTGTLRPFKYIKDTSTSSSNTYNYSWNIDNFYGTAEKWCLPELQDCIMDTYLNEVAATGVSPGPSGIRNGYLKTSENSGLRRFYAKCFAFALIHKDSSGIWDTRGMAELMGICDLAHDVLALLRTRTFREIINPIGLPRCDFHVHGKNISCNQRKPEKAIISAQSINW